MRHVEINGAPPTVAQLYRAATINYGHFTSMQVGEGAVPGLALHFLRLKNATRELFRVDLDESEVRSLLKHMLVDRPSASVRVTIFAGDEDLGTLVRGDVPNIMVTVTNPVTDEPQHAWSVRATRYVRDMPT